MDPDDEPQKPIPTTDEMQTAGHSYSTRSKVKRTSHCDDESSGSKAQEPLKRPTRPADAKQAGNSARIQNNDPTQNSNSNVVVSNAVDEYATPSTALQNDLVLETLFRYMGRRDLLTCRAVNKQWQSEVTKELRWRILIIRFSFHSQENNETSGNIVFRDICRRLQECQTPSLLSSFQVKIDARNDLGSTGVTSFFQIVGNQLKNLTLHLNYSKKRSSFEIRSLQTHLHNLLFRQAPNLEFLDINFDFPAHWEAMLEKLDVFGLGQSNQSDHNELLALRQLPNLKTFLMSGSPAPKFIADVIKAAVNLRSFGGAWSAFRTYVMGAEGIAKIHMLKSLSFQLVVYPQNQLSEHDFELVKTFVTEHKENLKLETLECVSGNFSEDWSYFDNIEGVINQFLECSSGSLLKLVIQQGSWFQTRLIIPRSPQLKEIRFDCFRRSDYYTLYGHARFFPRGFNMNMNHIFPNVSSIVLLRCSPDLFREFANVVGIELTEPVPSIRYITVIDTGKIGNIFPSLPTVTDFRPFFPNLVSISYVDNEKYYKM